MSTALYRWYDSNGELLYVGISSNAAFRAVQHETTKAWWSETATCRVEHFADRLEAERAETEAIASENPRFNRAHGRYTYPPSEASTGRRPFRELQAETQGAERRARIDQYKAEVIAEHVGEALAQLRTMREMTQAGVAEHLETRQSNVSRIEHQDDPLLATLRSYLESLGADLELTAVFGDERVLLEL